MEEGYGVDPLSPCGGKLLSKQPQEPSCLTLRDQGWIRTSKPRGLSSGGLLVPFTWP